MYDHELSDRLLKILSNDEKICELLIEYFSICEYKYINVKKLNQWFVLEFKLNNGN